VLRKNWSTGYIFEDCAYNDEYRRNPLPILEGRVNVKKYPFPKDNRNRSLVIASWARPSHADTDRTSGNEVRAAGIDIRIPAEELINRKGAIL
jgi:hypothetical protein